MGLCAYACVCLCPHTFTTCIPRELVYEIPAAQVSMLLQQHLISRVCYAYTIRRYDDRSDGECFVLFNVQFVCICYAICLRVSRGTITMGFKPLNLSRTRAFGRPTYEIRTNFTTVTKLSEHYTFNLNICVCCYCCLSS